MKKFNQLDKLEKKQLIAWISGIILICVVYLGVTCSYLYTDKISEEKYWTYYLEEHDQLTKEEQELSKNATKVKTGVYVENFDSIDIKNSNFNVSFKLWFTWTGNKNLDMINNYTIYRGKINSQKIIKDITVGEQRYQLAEVSATVSKIFWTTRFPMGSYQLRMYIEPQKSIQDILIEPDKNYSSINPNLNVSGFTLNKFASNRCIQEITNVKSDPEIQEKVFKESEFLVAFELNRKGIGLYIKCFIALAGTLGWVLITLFICTYHEVDPLGMIPSALFGTVSNILVGANLVPDAIQTGLIEFVNIYGILIILLVSFAIIKINRVRNFYNKNNFAVFLGKGLFWLITFFTILGNILLPLSAYKF
ncbi:hypothetical protein [Enterococcus sp. C76]|uniref:hypothetical protein n=1 Tax=Enterococcus sp. C76 TaxID=3231334 RepID=UPI0034A025E3